jgi:hypothetical protein
VDCGAKGIWDVDERNDATTARISHDQTFQPPFLPAWYALPMHLGYWGDTMVSANGRAYLIWANRAFNTSVSLIARDIHSGIKLWERPFAWNEPRDKNHSGYFSGRNCLSAEDDVRSCIREVARRPSCRIGSSVPCTATVAKPSGRLTCPADQLGTV